MPIRITGLASGLDTESIISALVSSYNYKTNKYKKAQTKLSWKQDAWKSLNTKIYSFYSSVGNLKFSSAYNLKSTTVSDSTKATIKASSSAPTGTQKLNILSVAQAGYLTGGQLSSSTTTSTTMAELGYTGGDAKINLTKGDGTTKEITVTQGTTVGSFIASLKDAGVSANYDETNHRIFISSKETGKDSDFTLTGANSDGARALYQLGLNVDSTATSNTYATYTKYAGANDSTGKSTEELVKAAIAEYQSAKTSYDKMSAQNANMTSAYGYASAYAAMKDALADSGLTDSADQEKLRTLLGMSATQRVNSVMDADGSVYTKKTTNDDGSVVYENNGKYILGVTTATDGTTTYTKDAQGNYVADGKVYKANGKKDADGNAYYVYKDDKGNETTVAMKDEKTTYYAATASEEGTGQYKYEDSNGVVYTPNDTGTYAGSDGNTYNFDASTSTFTQVDSKGNVVSGGKTATVSDTQKSQITKTVYTKGAAVSDAKRSADVLTSLKEDANYKLTDAETTTLASNIEKVNVYESADDKLGDDTDEYARKNIISKIQQAYASGANDGTSAEKIAEITNTYAAVINSNQTAMEKAQTTMNDNSVLADLAAMDTSTTEGQAALKEFIKKVDDINALASDPTIKTNSDAKKIDGSDSEIQLNGITYTSSLNTYSINGLSITALQATGAGDTNAITVTTATDTQGVYDKVKSFLTQYNALINEITSLYNADTAKGYEPLTDDEKSAMSDSEVEKWEEKIKSSLLRRDDSLESVMNAMTNAMSQPVTVNGKNYYLSSFGIKTLGYLNAPTNQQYAYHIDGDEEDTASSGNADKLMAMINSDPDTVVSFMQQLATNVYDAIGKKMQTSSLSSIYKVYNDKEMASEYSDYTTTIKKWEQKLQDQEDAYYKKFSAMETALSKLQSQTSSMSSLFGS